MLRELLAFASLAPLAAANQVALTPACSRTLGYPGPNAACNVAWFGDGTDVWLRNHYVVAFDVAAQVPAGSTVSAAVLSFQTFASSEPGAFRLHELLAPACPGAAWAGSPLGLGTSAGPEFATVGAPGGTWSPSVTSSALANLVQNWIGAPAQNFGILFVPQSDFMEVCVSNVALVVDFTPPCPAPVSYCIAAQNSVSPSGAHLSITGSTSLAQNDLVLVASGVRPGAPGFFYFGATQQQIPLGNGYSCAGTPLFRLAAPNLFADASGVLRRPVDFTVGSALNIQPGSVWNFQVKYRDIPGGGAGYNFTDGLQLTFCP